MTKTPHQYAVIGAGLTGLTLAYYLKKAGKDVTVFERNDKVGGVINSVSKDGFLFETGPNTGVISSPELVQLFDELNDKIQVETANEDAKYRWVWKKGNWHPLPFSLKSAVNTPLFTFKDKFRILGEPFRKKGSNPDESVADLVLRRLGRSYLDYAVDPFVSGIYAGDPHKLITRFALPKLHRLEQDYGSFIKGSIAKQKQPKSEMDKRVSRKVFSIKGGLVQLIHALEEVIGKENIKTCSHELLVQPEDNAFKIRYNDSDQKSHEVLFSSVITTVSGNNLPDMLPFLEEQSRYDLTNMNYAKVVQVVACYKNWTGKTLKAFGGLVPSTEKRNVLGILFPSSIFPGRAPKDGAVLSVFTGGSRRPDVIEMDDLALKKMVKQEIHETLDCNADPDLMHIYRYQHAIPQYEITSEKRLQTINTIQENYPGLILAGNIRDGIGMPDRVKQATEIAMNLTGENGLY